MLDIDTAVIADEWPVSRCLVPCRLGDKVGNRMSKEGGMASVMVSGYPSQNADALAIAAPGKRRIYAYFSAICLGEGTTYLHMWTWECREGVRFGHETGPP